MKHGNTKNRTECYTQMFAAPTTETVHLGFLQQYIAGLIPFDFCLQEVTTQEGFYIVLHYWCTAAVDAE